MEIYTQAYLANNQTTHLGSIISQQHTSQHSVIPTEVYVRSSSFCMKLDRIQLTSNTIQMRLICLHNNFSPILIPKVYHSEIIQSIKHKFEDDDIKIMFCVNNPMVFFLTTPYRMSLNIQFDQILENMVSQLMEQINKNLQYVGIIKRYNVYGGLLKKKSLELRKRVVEIIRNHQESKQSFSKFYDELNKNDQRSIKKAYQIQQQTQSDTQNKMKQGGYFKVLKQQCKIQFDKIDQKTENRFLAVKRSKTQKIQCISHKLRKQLDIVKKIKNQKFIGIYYDCQTQKQDILYMKYIPYSLKEMIYSQSLTLQQSIHLSLQLVCGVKNLHDSDIIHRDLKPQNALIEINQNKKILRIIDFGESTKASDNNYDTRLGCTLPYSPPECRVDPDKGFNKKEIDLWSILMIIYEMTFRSLPFSFTRIIGKDIIEGWKDPQKFSIFPNIRKHNGLRSTQQIISLMVVMGLKIDQKQRPSLMKTFTVLEQLKNFRTQCSNFFN